MSHHADFNKKGSTSFLDEALGKELKKKQKQFEKFMPFPEGIVNKDDEGSLACAIASKDGKVFLQFAKPTSWVGFNPQQAVEIAQQILKHAQRASKKPLTLKYPY